MRDGQVHDVAAVARTVRRAVEHVSRAVGVEFAGAHIAAAGRALKTARGGAERSEPQPVLITPALADMLEWEAVADAQRQLLESLPAAEREDRKSTRLNSSHVKISYAVFCLKK